MIIANHGLSSTWIQDFDYATTNVFCNRVVGFLYPLMNELQHDLLATNDVCAVLASLEVLVE